MKILTPEEGGDQGSISKNKIICPVCQKNNKQITSSKCHSCENKSRTYPSMIGKKIDKLLIVSFSHSDYRRHRFWISKCDCGNERLISTPEFNRKRCKILCCGKCKTDEQRFYEYFDKKDGCWNWKGNLSGCKGYGRISINGKIIKAHRYSYKLFKGEFDQSLCVLHKCDNPKCVNPDHLFLGTFNDNNQDRKRKGRGRKSKKVKEIEIN